MVKHSQLRFRVMHPAGRYPRGIVSCEDGLLAEAFYRDYVFSVVRLTPTDEHQSEICWAVPSEIRFWASIALAYQEKAWSLCMYPSRVAALPFADAEFDDKFVWQVALHFDRSFLREYVAGLGTYHFNEDAFNPDLQTQLITAIDLKDAVLIRGLSSFLKANILASEELFMEEATLQMFLAMEASLNVARKQLEAVGVSNPSIDRAIEYVSSGVAPKEDALEYFRECYDKRVTLVHPGSRVTSDLVPLLWADDLYDNYEVVANVYRRLLLNNANAGRTKPE